MVTDLLNFISLLPSIDIDPAETLVVRHVPFEKSLKRVLPWLVVERPELWRAYRRRTQVRSCDRASTWSSNLPFGKASNSCLNSASHGASAGNRSWPASIIALTPATRDFLSLSGRHGIGKWYRSGRRYRNIDEVDGVPNQWLQRWLMHPDYDAYWQAMVPYGADFAKIDIPVLTITGYYDDGQISALRYLKEHYRYKPDADHYLVIGPYDHFGAQQRFKEPELRGYVTDPIAQFDTTELTFAWFDHIFRDTKRPPLLEDRINYQVIGANVWRHASSLEAMSDMRWDYYLTNSVTDGGYKLSREKPTKTGAIRQSVDFADRTGTSANYYPYPIIDKDLDLSKGLVFLSEPLQRSVEVSGAFSGVMRVRINKRDFDFSAALYEQRADGSTMALSHYLGRASYARAIETRELLKPGAISTLPFERTRVTSRSVAAGSRFLLVVDVLKGPFHQVNHGTGKDVSDETIADADQPLTVEWQEDSFVRIPVTVQ